MASLHSQLLILILITLLPFFELRASIPLGIVSGSVNLPFGYTLSGFGLPWYLVFIIVVVTNIFLGMAVYLIIQEFIHLFLKIKIFNKFYQHYSKNVYEKINKYTEKYGKWGLMIFIGLPVPGSGSYSGALAAHLIGLSFKKFVVANALGVLIAGTLVTLLTLGIIKLF
ncbi:small multi-drug export protein [Candidatus Woesearchaeota archaeon]|nr:small multi-drug export protein [Candidatus Woesearchaeota archaeon]